MLHAPGIIFFNNIDAAEWAFKLFGYFIFNATEEGEKIKLEFNDIYRNEYPYYEITIHDTTCACGSIINSSPEHDAANKAQWLRRSEFTARVREVANDIKFVCEDGAIHCMYKDVSLYAGDWSGINMPLSVAVK